jgi:hypothetical protein
MTTQIPSLKTAISVKEMAALCGLSRQRFAQLVKAGAFPAPLYDVATRRPFYPEEMQQVCLEVRRRNFGVNAKAVLFYSRRSPTPPPKAKTKQDGHPDIVEGVKALGLTTVLASQVAEAIKELYPSGSDKTDQSEVIRMVFLHLRRKDSGVKAGSK